MLPPSAKARISAQNFTEPLSPSASPLIPFSASVRSSYRSTVAAWGVVYVASNDSAPPLSAVSRITSTWSGWLTNTSRV